MLSSLLLFTGLSVLELDEQQPPKLDPCTEPCKAAWYDSKKDLGGIECEHGPEQDKDCVVCGRVVRDRNGKPVFVPIAESCCEDLAGKKCTFVVKVNGKSVVRIGTIPDCEGKGGGGLEVCECFACTTPKDGDKPKPGEPGGCEGRIYQWDARCGGALKEKPNPDGKCDFYIPKGDKKNKPPIQPIRMEVNMVLGAADSCKGKAGSTNKIGRNYYCGRFGIPVQYADCISDACKTDPLFKGWPEDPCKVKDGKFPGGSVECGVRIQCRK
jgi:hypothetical protein